MENFITLFLFILMSGLFGLISTLVYINKIDRLPGICCHHKPDRVHDYGGNSVISYFECKKCGERSFKLSENIYSLEANKIYVNVPWLCGLERILK